MEKDSVNTTARIDAATELRYALDVMEEYSHLGLDDEFAGKLREILVKRIERRKAPSLLNRRSWRHSGFRWECRSRIRAALGRLGFQSLGSRALSQQLIVAA